MSSLRPAALTTDTLVEGRRAGVVAAAVDGGLPAGSAIVLVGPPL
jgi:hypothetical protein